MASNGKYQFGPYAFDTKSGLLTNGSETTALRPKIADLLRVLMESAPEMVSKEDLLARVWPDTNVVDSGLARDISELRKALSEEPEAIETIPKRGYRFTLNLAGGTTTDQAAASGAPQRFPHWARRAATLAISGLGVAVSAPFLLLRLGKSDNAPAYAQSAEDLEAEVRKAGGAGYFHWGKWEEQGMREALVHFRRAASLDARLWYGYTGMADAYVGLVLLSNRVDPEWSEWAHHAANRSIQLDSKIAAAHCALGAVRLIVDWDLHGAGAAFDEALRSNPFNYAAYQRRGLLRTIQGRFSEARVDLRKAVELKPEHFDGQVFWAWSEFCGKDFDQAIRVLEELPPWPGKRRQALRVLTAVHGMKRDFAAARNTLAEAKLWPADEVAVRAWLDARQGNAAAAEAGLDRLRAICHRENIQYCETAVIEAELGRVDKAFASLEQGLSMRHWKVLALIVDPRLEPLHQDPRWGAILARVRPLERL